MSVILIFTILLATIFFIIGKITKSECKHTHFTRYESWRIKRCIDCCLEFPLHETHLPKHQR